MLNRSLLLLLVVSSSSSPLTTALVPNTHPANTNRLAQVSSSTMPLFMSPNEQNNDEKAASIPSLPSRRAFISTTFASIALATTASQPAFATLMDMSVEGTSTFKPGQKLSVSDSKKRFSLARGEIQYLLDNYSSISKEGGDSVRRYLGTVGVNSNMYGISKVLKDLRDESEDVVEYQETLDEFNAYLFQAEGAAYQSLFVEHSSAKGTPESLLATAKKDVVSMQKFMDQLAVQLSL
mmetsp:Transcript_8748/g.12723  ORF Transcript_8748/g.12723 Transcript_8748/m.12723 type:complete len:237 (+) Transcript_8748:209-919(+)